MSLQLNGASQVKFHSSTKSRQNKKQLNQNTFMSTDILEGNKLIAEFLGYVYYEPVGSF